MFKHEKWTRTLDSEQTLASRSPRKNEQKKMGFAALKAYDMEDSDPAYTLLKTLQDYRIYTPTTNILRGVVLDTQMANPLGLSGGRLPEAIGDLMWVSKKNKYFDRLMNDFFSLITWAEEFSMSFSTSLSLSPSAATSHRILRFKDKFMSNGRNVISGYDASEGALYVLFLTALIALPDAPKFCAVDNADHGLNPVLLKQLFTNLSQWVIDRTEPKQILMTVHNPLVLDGLLLSDERIRLFAVDRTSSGKTKIERINVTESILEKAKTDGLTLSRLWTMGYFGGTHNV
jgi:hypothetical protein